MTYNKYDAYPNLKGEECNKEITNLAETPPDKEEYQNELPPDKQANYMLNELTEEEIQSGEINITSACNAFNINPASPTLEADLRKLLMQYNEDGLIRKGVDPKKAFEIAWRAIKLRKKLLPLARLNKD